MDRRERAASPADALLAALQGFQAELWTALPGVVKAYRRVASDGIVVDVQPAIQASIRQPNGELRWINMPLLLDCPVYFPSGGGFTLTFPIAVDDECLVVFSSRCIDAWHESGGHANQQAELRMHDLSDGFAFVGFRSRPRTLSPAAHPTSVELRSDDGETKIAIRQDTKVSVVSPAEIILTAPLVTIAGDLHVTGEITTPNEVTADGIALTSHRHTGVDTGSGTSGPPTP